ncbi:formate dehydrogenase subunit delta [Allorhizobium taibaishanense]|uniref:Formate dehydrogenase n=1 Tax=Allorhizobium taibaishanense TaxID=887144 RepID=A0A1Q9A1S3_9HYPH|nr:formate dehydrogenase subunit delta [Allorhizobium taibaishanense]MBB4009230.1 formate dehydrogenase subunit delta [Allorhizobium taibaishanense]OLP48496.1 formate dehydrogenase [Allorhizobium taibaishanense]
MSHEQNAEKLIRMANQIATFFKSQPEAERLAGIATHINKFWEPRMRRQFFEMIDGQSEGFDPLVVEAAKQVVRPVDNSAATFGLSASRSA